MNYTQLDDTYKYDTLADAIYGREIEYFHYDFDRKNFEHLLANLPEGSYAQDIAKRLADTVMQMENVKAIMAALLSQIDDQAAYDEAVLRAIEKRKEK
jgi:Asp-tRNA(Asn)/Glu-tRNA(Gln) amidotransferase B subunit